MRHLWTWETQLPDQILSFTTLSWDLNSMHVLSMLHQSYSNSFTIMNNSYFKLQQTRRGVNPTWNWSIKCFSKQQSDIEMSRSSVRFFFRQVSRQFDLLNKSIARADNTSYLHRNTKWSIEREIIPTI